MKKDDENKNISILVSEEELSIIQQNRLNRDEGKMLKSFFTADEDSWMENAADFILNNYDGKYVIYFAGPKLTDNIARNIFRLVKLHFDRSSIIQAFKDGKAEINCVYHLSDPQRLTLGIEVPQQNSSTDSVSFGYAPAKFPIPYYFNPFIPMEYYQYLVKEVKYPNADKAILTVSQKTEVYNGLIISNELVTLNSKLEEYGKLLGKVRESEYEIANGAKYLINKLKLS